MSENPRDQWADWLVSGRQRGLDGRQLARMNLTLARLRDRVIRGARLRRGYRVLDVGAGTGLLALDAARKVSSSGSVVAVDPSLDALAVCRSAAESDLPLATCIGDGHYLPFAAESFDAVLTRSVLIYLEEKPLAIREIHRVLRKGGVTSIFEPINRAPQDYLRGEESDWDDKELLAQHRRVGITSGDALHATKPAS